MEDTNTHKSNTDRSETECENVAKKSLITSPHSEQQETTVESEETREEKEENEKGNGNEMEKEREKEKEKEKSDQYFLCQNLDKAVYAAPVNVEFQKETDKLKEEKKNVFLFGMNEEQKEEANKLKIDRVIENEIYLKKNKVLKYTVQIFLADLLKEKPEDVYSFAATYFTQPNLRKHIGQRLRETLLK